MIATPIGNETGRFHGKTAVVTGGSRGIGLAIAERLAEEGARVLITGRKQAALDEALAHLPPGRARGVAGRADDPNHRRDVYGVIAAEFGGLDILVANAGINPVFGSLMDLSLETARKIWEVNVLAPLAWVQAAVATPALDFRRRGGNVVILSSITGQTPSVGLGWYGVTKAANAHLARTLGVELGPEIRVNAVAPAVVKTRFSEALYEGNEDEVSAVYPLRRLGDPNDVAAAVAFVASDDADWITGQVLTLDGGLLAAGGRA